MESKSSVHESISWKLIDSFFKSDPQILVQHHIQSYNNFFNTKIKQLIKEKNPITFFKEQERITTLDKIKFFDEYRNEEGQMLPLSKEDLKNKLSDKSKEYIEKIWESAQESKGGNRTKQNTRTDYRFRFDMYIGGKNADRLYYGKPIIYDEERGEHIMYPNEARLRNMTYAFTLHADIVVDFTIFLKNQEIQGTHIEHNETIEIPKVYFGRFPIMLQSDLCVLSCGTLILEACALGVPSLGIVLAENQKNTAEFLKMTGAIELYDMKNNYNSTIYSSINSLLGNSQELLNFSKKQKQVVSKSSKQTILRNIYE